VLRRNEKSPDVDTDLFQLVSMSGDFSLRRKILAITSPKWLHSKRTGPVAMKSRIKKKLLPEVAFLIIIFGP